MSLFFLFWIPFKHADCALICSPEFGDEDTAIDMELDDDFMLRGAGAAAAAIGGGECGAATCQAIGGAGICTYSE